jgi:nucleotide-binding universal stress UspA family protein
MISSAKHILIPTDFSDSSKNALKHAAVIADRLGARITLLHVIDPPFNFPTNVDGVIDYLKENAEQHLENMTDLIEKKYPEKKFQIKSQIRIGKPTSQITEAISDLDIDLVVIGSGMDNPARKVLFGSVSTDIILRSPKPVLSVPSNITSFDFSRILFTTNFRDGDMKNLRELSEFAKLFDSSIHILHVAKDDNLETQIKFRGMKEIVQDSNLYDDITFEMRQDLDAFSGISDYVISKDITMMVMNRYRKSIVGLLLDKNYAKRMSIYTTVPLLVLVGETSAVAANTAAE